MAHTRAQNVAGQKVVDANTNAQQGLWSRIQNSGILRYHVTSWAKTQALGDKLKQQMSPRSRKVKDLFLSVIIILGAWAVFSRYDIVGSMMATSPRYSASDVSRSLVMYDKNTVKYIPFQVISYNYLEVVGYDELVWSDYAYVQYATDWDYLCGAMMNFAYLRNVNTKVDLVLLVAKNVKIDRDSKEGKIFYQNVKDLDVKVHTVGLLKLKSESTTWNKSFTKFNAFKLTEYKRVIYLDSDSKILRKMDELFFLPECKIAMPAAYELNYNYYEDKNYEMPPNFKVLDKEQRDIRIKMIYEDVSKQGDLETYLARIYNRLPDLTITEGFQFENQIMVIKPSIEEFNRLMKLAYKKAAGEYDMDIVNKAYNVDNVVKKQWSTAEEDLNIIPDVLILPHLEYGFLTGEFRYINHDIMLADPQDMPFVISDKLPKASNAYWGSKHWDSSQVFHDRVRFIHFSDHPIPKPWIEQHLPNDYAQVKIVCEDDHQRLAAYEEYNAQQSDERYFMMPAFTTDCDAATIWNNLYEDYIEDRQNTCGLPLKT